MQDQTSLPPGYEELEPLVEYWAGATNDIRWDRRSRAAMPEIRRFYDAMLPRADEALSYLEQFPLGDMPANATRLFCLLLSLPHAAMAVEFHRQPRAASSPFPHGMNIQPGPWPQGG
ncbi:MAG: hypothetical protein ACT4QA_11100 [Panacagrimonas sp.]